MSVALAPWLTSMSGRLAADFDAFDLYAFEGTGGEFQTAVAAWTCPHGAALRELDLDEVTADASNAEVARASIEKAIAQLAANPRRALIAISGMHLLAALYPDGILKPLIEQLRRGSRVVVLIFPPPPTQHLPETAHLSPWRETIQSGSAGIGPGRTIVRGGD